MYRKFKPLFFWAEPYRRTGELSIDILFDENPAVASAGLSGAGGRVSSWIAIPALIPTHHGTSYTNGIPRRSLRSDQPRQRPPEDFFSEADCELFVDTLRSLGQ